MEDSSYSALKNSLSSISAKALNYSSRLILANNLDCKQILPSEKGFARDYRGLAELIGFQYSAIKKFEESEDRTMKILDSWGTRSDATLDKLISFLEDMDRHDVIEDLIPLLKKNVETYLDYQKSLESPIQVAEVTPGPTNLHSKKGALTRDDLRNGECTIYDAYVSYADEDSHIAAEFARILESPKVGLKLFIRGRDMLAGCSELDTDIELIKNRCRHMLILLTANFIESPAAEFQVSFASSLAIEQKQRILIPVILAHCEIPPVLGGVSKIDFTKQYTQEWMWDKLIASLQPEDNTALFVSSVGSPIKSKNVIFSPSSISTENRPEITFYQPTRQILCNGNNSTRVTQDYISNLTSPVSTENRPLIIFPQSEKNSLPHQLITISPTGISEDEKDSGAYNEMKDSVVSSEMKDIFASSEVKEAAPSATKTSPSPRKKSIQQLFSIFNRKGSSSNAPSTSFSSGATSGFHSQSYSNMKSLENSNDHYNDDTSL